MAEPEIPCRRHRTALRAVLFDAGGTLIHMPRTAEEILSDLCRQMGFYISPEQALSAHRASEQYYIQHYLHYGGDQGSFWHAYHGEAMRCLGIEDPDGARAALLSHGFGRAGTWQACPGAPAACERLAGMGLRMGVISNGPATVRDLLEQAGLLQFFEVVIASQDLGVEKPDPAIFRLALDRLGIEAGEALFVGDLYDVDVVGARQVGMAVVLIDPDGQSREDCSKVRSLEELVPLVERLVNSEVGTETGWAG